MKKISFLIPFLFLVVFLNFEYLHSRNSNEIYKKIIDVHGVIMEFGTRWGQNLALFGG
mgnify:CR=1 FL=1